MPTPKKKATFTRREVRALLKKAILQERSCCRGLACIGPYSGNNAVGIILGNFNSRALNESLTKEIIEYVLA